MKSIGIIIDFDKGLAEFIERNIKDVFDDLVVINKYFLNQLTCEMSIKDDVVLVMSKERTLYARRYIDDNENIVVIKRTVKDEDIFKVVEIPPNTDVLVVNDTEEVTLETVSLLYQIGISHLNLIPYEEGKEYIDIDIAVTPGVVRKVPRYIDKVIDIGNRYIDISTFIEIINKLNINNQDLRRRLINYSNTIITLDNGIKESIKNLYIKNEELDTIFNLSKEGILLLNTDYNILRYNKTFTNMFSFRETIIGKNLKEIFENEVFKLIQSKEIIDEYVNISEKAVLISKYQTYYLNSISGYYISFHEITHIKKMEQSLSKKLRNNGLIARYTFDDIIVEDEMMIECIELAKKLSKSNNTIMITGESGTGKELLAQSIHNYSSRNIYPMVAVNCAAISESLLESELFGYEAGSFTGALKGGKMGYFEMAHNGTIFLDEIGDMPLSLQTRLLRVLQEKQVMRIGSNEIINVDVRVIAATNKNLYKMVNDGLFRKDLYYRINVLPIRIPALRNRKKDIIPLIEFFLMKENVEMGEDIKNVLLEYNWPGNIRELENIASYIMALNINDVGVKDLPYYIFNQTDDFEEMFNHLLSNEDIDMAVDIISIIREFNANNVCIGRKKIESEFILRGIDTKESEIRRLINDLNKRKLLKSGTGRMGTRVTLLGENFANWYRNR